MNYQITLFGRIDWTAYGLTTITVQDTIEIIRTGNYFINDSKRSGMWGTLAEVTRQIQALPDGANIQAAKQQFLPAVSFNGMYQNGIVKYSNVTALDFDHIPSEKEYSDLYQHLMAIPCVGWIYRTPSGRGLKALVIHDNDDPGMHGNLYRQLMQMFQTPFIGTDPKCQDLNRRNYLCYDPDVWTNPSPVPYHFVYDATYDTTTISVSIQHQPKQKQSVTERTTPIVAPGTPSDASIMNMLKSRCMRFHPDYLVEGARRDGVYWFGTQAAKAGVEYLYGLEYVKKLFQSEEITLIRGGAFTEDEITENYTNGYDAENYDEEFRRSFKAKKHEGN